MAGTHKIGTEKIQMEATVNLMIGNKKLALSTKAKQKIRRSRKFLEKTLSTSDKSFYGINTGFGSLCNQKISDKDLAQLQENLVVSHACGMGDEVPLEIARLILFLKIKNLSFGYSGVRLDLVEQLIKMFNAELTPVIFELGSLGASGDLAPLAHLSLGLIGKGEVRLQGKKLKAKTALNKVGLKALTLKSKEGLALLNGTQFSLAYGLWCIHHGQRLLELSNMIAAISMDAYMCDLGPFDADIHRIRGQKGQIEIARKIRKVLKGSRITTLKKETVQDPYSFRCIPQVHGASKDTIDHVRRVLEIELNAVTDNPNIFPDKNKILTGGNFHAQPVGFALDFLSIALSELGSISERRTYKLINGDRGLPDFLVTDAGLNSGLMIPQYTAASIASQNKQLGVPATLDSIVSSKGQEDHVSMAANAGTKCKRVVDNIYRLLAIEFICAIQALAYRRPLKTAPILEKIISRFAGKLTSLDKDKLMHEDMVRAEGYLRNLNISELQKL